MAFFRLRTLVLGSIVLMTLPVSAWASQTKPQPQLLAVSNRSAVAPEDTAAKQKQQLALKAQEQKEAVEEVNALIVDSYKALLDKVLDQLYANVAEASRGDRSVQVRALTKVRDDLDKQLDGLEDENITPNRKKILQGVYFYLKSNVEQKIQTLQKK